MNVPVISMDKQQAKKAFLAYKEAVRRQHDKEYEALVIGYRELAKGKVLLDLLQVFQKAGTDEQARPRLAIARADIKNVFMRRYPDGSAVFTDDRWNIASRHGSRKRIHLPVDTFPRRGNSIDANAVVPLVPAQFKPRGSLANYHVLWEAEWQNVPVDPMLLKHLHGTLYAVLATWDLTTLEQAVLRGRL